MGRKYEKLGFLGEGAYGRVKKVRRVRDSKVLACKTIYIDDNGATNDDTEREYGILRNLHHPNIVGYIDYECIRSFSSGDNDNDHEHNGDALKVKLFMEYCPGGSLQDLIDARSTDTNYVDEDLIWKIIYQLSSALRYCHFGIDATGARQIHRWQPILHRDIKPANVFVALLLVDSIMVKLGDFGLATVVNPERPPTSFVGTRLFQPPEISEWNSGPIRWTKMSDIFSLGCTVHALCSLKLPINQHMRANEKPPNLPDYYSTNLQSCVLTCQAQQPGDRYDACDLVTISEAKAEKPASQSQSDDFPDKSMISHLGQVSDTNSQPEVLKTDENQRIVSSATPTTKFASFDMERYFETQSDTGSAKLESAKYDPLQHNNLAEMNESYVPGHIPTPILGEVGLARQAEQSAQRLGEIGSAFRELYGPFEHALRSLVTNTSTPISNVANNVVKKTTFDGETTYAIEPSPESSQDIGSTNQSIAVKSNHATSQALLRPVNRAKRVSPNLSLAAGPTQDLVSETTLDDSASTWIDFALLKDIESQNNSSNIEPSNVDTAGVLNDHRQVNLAPGIYMDDAKYHYTPRMKQSSQSSSFKPSSPTATSNYSKLDSYIQFSKLKGEAHKQTNDISLEQVPTPEESSYITGDDSHNSNSTQSAGQMLNQVSMIHERSLHPTTPKSHSRDPVIWPGSEQTTNHIFDSQYDDILGLSPEDRSVPHESSPSFGYNPTQKDSAAQAWSAFKPGAEILYDWNKPRITGLLSGHISPVCCVAFSPDGKILASGSTDRIVRLWGMETRLCLRSLLGHEAPVYAIAISPSGKLCVSGSENGSVWLWDVQTHKGRELKSYHSGSIFSIAISPDSEIIASATQHGIIRLHNLVTGEIKRMDWGNGGAIFSVAFSPDGETLASGSSDKNIELWDIAKAKHVSTISVYSFTIRSVAFSPDGTLLASCSDEESIHLIDTLTLRVVRHMPGHLGKVNSVTFSPDGKLLASGSSDKTIRIWDVKTGEHLQILSDEDSSTVFQVAFSPDGRLLASASHNKLIRIWQSNLWTSQKQRGTMSKELIVRSAKEESTNKNKSLTHKEEPLLRKQIPVTDKDEEVTSNIKSKPVRRPFLQRIIRRS